MSHERVMLPSEKDRWGRANKIRDAIWGNGLEVAVTRGEEGAIIDRQKLQSRIALRIIMRAESGELFETPVVGQYRDVSSIADGYKHHENREKRDLARAARRADRDVEVLKELWG